jgi:hypothetical protein
MQAVVSMHLSRNGQGLTFKRMVLTKDGDLPWQVLVMGSVSLLPSAR